MSLVEFLLARLAEDEHEANACLDQYRRGDGGSAQRWLRQLADVEAKRRIVEECVATRANDGGPTANVLASIVLEAVAQPYADHPEFDEAWV